MQSNLTKLVPFFGYASIAAMFAWGLFDANFATTFILPSGFMIFVLEFISIHSTMFTNIIIRGFKGTKKVPGIVGLYAVYSIFVAGFGVAVGNLISLPFFWFTSAMKIIDQRNSKESKIISEKYILSFVAFILITLGVTFLSPAFCLYSQGINQEALFSSSNGQASGLFVDCPLTLAIWGTIYFTLMAIVELLPETFMKKLISRNTKMPGRYK